MKCIVLWLSLQMAKLFRVACTSSPEGVSQPGGQLTRSATRDSSWHPRQACCTHRPLTGLPQSTRDGGGCTLSRRHVIYIHWRLSLQGPLIGWAFVPAAAVGSPNCFFSFNFLWIATILTADHTLGLFSDWVVRNRYQFYRISLSHSSSQTRWTHIMQCCSVSKRTIQCWYCAAEVSM